MNTFDIMETWAQALVTDAELGTLCSTTFGAPLKVFVGLDVAHEPEKKDAPYVCLQPAGDERGPEAEEHRWGIIIYFGVHVQAKPDKTANIVTEPAIVAMERQFAPAVMRVLAGTTCPPVVGEGTTHPAKGGYAERDMVVTVREPNVIGIGSDGWQ